MSSPWKILLVEDDSVDAETVRRALEFDDQDFDLTTNRCLQEGVETLRQGNFDALLLDLTLPDSYGIGTVQRMLEEFATLPIIVLSGVNDESLALESVSLGVQDYLVKEESSVKRLPQAIAFAVERVASSERSRDKQPAAAE